MKRILVVEDEASIRELVALNLKMTGWEVLEAPSAERALELIQKNPPCDVALLDIMLPGLDGYELLDAMCGLATAPPDFKPNLPEDEYYRYNPGTR